MKYFEMNQLIAPFKRRELSKNKIIINHFIYHPSSIKSIKNFIFINEINKFGWIKQLISNNSINVAIHSSNQNEELIISSRNYDKIMPAIYHVDVNGIISNCISISPYCKLFFT
jgi:hypothetical protein